jgi:hypothetical protein
VKVSIPGRSGAQRHNPERYSDEGAPSDAPRLDGKLIELAGTDSGDEGIPLVLIEREDRTVGIF